MRLNSRGARAGFHRCLPPVEKEEDAIVVAVGHGEAGGIPLAVFVGDAQVDEALRDDFVTARSLHVDDPIRPAGGRTVLHPRHAPDGQNAVGVDLRVVRDDYYAGCQPAVIQRP